MTIIFVVQLHLFVCISWISYIWKQGTVRNVSKMHTMYNTCYVYVSLSGMSKEAQREIRSTSMVTWGMIKATAIAAI